MFKYFNNIFFRKTMIVILPIGLLVLIYHYLNISNNYLKEQLEIEKYIQNSLYTVEKSYNAIENILEKQMEKNMQEFLNEYDKVEDISKLNLSELKIKFGGDTDLYIINENGVIISSTDEKDIGIDFKKWSEFYKTLIEVKNKGTFYPTKFGSESSTGKIRKYSYQSTRDKKYIFELGLKSETLESYMKDLDYNKISLELIDKYSGVEGVRIFDLDGWQRSFSGVIAPTEEELNIIEKIKLSKEVYTVKTKDSTIRYIFTNFTEDNYLNRVVEIKYNNKPIKEEIFKNLITIIIGSSIAFMFIARFTIVFFNMKMHKIEYKLTLIIIFLIGLDFVLQRFDIFKYKSSSFVIVIVLGILFYEFYLVIKKQHEKIERFLTSDKITGLPSRYYLNKEVSRLNNKKENFILVGLVIENIDEILNTIGHSKGDLILKTISDYLTNINPDTAIKIFNSYSTNYEFLMNDNVDIENWAKELKKYTQTYPVNFGEYKIYLKIYLGICYSGTLEKEEDVIKNVYKAVDYAIKANKDYYIYDHMTKHSITSTYLISKLEKSLKENELFLEYQPKLSLIQNKIYGIEALVRWNDKEYGRIAPNIFIPLLEKTESIRMLTQWIIEKSIKDLKEFNRLGLNLICSINITPKDLEDKEFSVKLLELLKKYEVEPAQIELEITETDLIKEMESVREMLYELNDKGIKVSIDDFGTGYSSLSYLHSLQVDTIKIDKSFIDSLLINSNKQELLKHVIQMSHDLKKEVIAEGVEDYDTLVLLKKMKCENIQGYYISKPLAKDKLEEFLLKFKGY